MRGFLCYGVGMIRAVTLGDLALHGRLVECGCTACNRVDYLSPDDMDIPLNVEVPLISRFWCCRGCGARNTPTSGPVWVRPDPRT